MEDYKKESVYLGISDVASLTIVGCTSDGLRAEILKMGGDGEYHAYVVRNWEGLLPEHYKTVMNFRFFCQSYNADGSRGEVLSVETWVKIFDDSGKMTEFRAKEISILRAGDYGILIHLQD